MRNAFAKAVTELGDTRQDLVLLAGDIGNRLFDDFRKKHPSRFYNCGVAEANMIGVAAGLAASGFHPITYTITPFTTARVFEQIRLDICYPNLPVIVVGTGAGLSYAELGATHHSMEDIALLRSLPNMHVLCPADQTEVKLAVREALSLRRPTYIRLGKKGEPAVHEHAPEFSIGRGIVMREGSDAALFAVGNMVHSALAAAKLLEDRGVSTRVVSLHTVKPLDTSLLRSAFDQCGAVAVIEEHGLAGGASSAVLEWANDAGLDTRTLLRFGGPDRFLAGCGDQDEARHLLALTPDHIAQRIATKLASA